LSQPRRAVELQWSSLSYDVSADGRKLVVASPGGDSASTMALVSDWSAIVK
jgi:hypothetical protein